MTGLNRRWELGAICRRIRRPWRRRWPARIRWRCPRLERFQPDAVRSGFNPLKDYDYTLFTQSVFADWVKQMRDLIR